MIIRVTLPTGVVARYEVADAETVLALREKVAKDMGMQAALVVLANDRTLSAAVPTRLNMRSAGLQHGSMLFAGSVSTARGSSSSSSVGTGAAAGGAHDTSMSPPPSASAHPRTPPPDEITPANCPMRHGPHTVCVKCMPRTARGHVACNHPPSVRCPNCIATTAPAPASAPAAAAGAAAAAPGGSSALCRHGPGVHCVNCPPLVDTPRLACNHPAHVTCPKCVGDKQSPTAAASASAAAGGPAQGPNRMGIKCLHGPHGRCTNCMGPERAAQEEELDDEPIVCRNHGPHGSCVECMQRREQRLVHVKRQADAACAKVAVDYHAASGFQSYVSLHRFRANRVGWMYGRHEDDGSTTVHGIYEPPQEATEDGCFSLLEDPHAEMVETVAGLLGLGLVGWIFSHGARDNLLTSLEIERMAELQNRHGPRFVTMVLSPTAAGKSKVEAFQASEQAMLLQKKGLFTASEDPSFLSTSKPVVIENRETHTIDNHWVIVNVPVAASKSRFALCSFPVENRVDAPQVREDLRDHIKEHGKKPFYTWASDFHLLLYVCREILREDPEIVAICEAVSAGRQCEGAEEIIRACAM
eukprot:m51a1_g5326 hypothetical protein (585) ;mRNA; r:373503-375938